MEFKFRSIHRRTSTYYPHSPNFPPHSHPHFSYFTHQAIRAGFTTPELGHREVRRNPIEVRGTMPALTLREEMLLQRELEKERIRAEIIAEEIAKRRVLEEEVRREIMMEREIAIRFGRPDPILRLEPRLPLLTTNERFGVSTNREVGFRGFETLPFQRDPGVGNGNGNDNENRTPSRVGLQEIRGTRTSSEVAKDKVVILAKPSFTAADLKRKATSQPDGTTAQLISSGSKKQKTKDDWSCALCHVSATSERGLKEHLRGKKHKARERKLVAPKTGFGTALLPKKNISSSTNNHSKASGLDSISLPSSTSKDEKEGGTKENSAQNKKDSSVEKKKKPKNGTKTKKGPVTAKSTKAKKKLRFWCEVCQVGAHSQTVMDAHKNGKRHLAAAS